MSDNNQPSHQAVQYSEYSSFQGKQDAVFKHTIPNNARSLQGWLQSMCQAKLSIQQLLSCNNAETLCGKNDQIQVSGSSPLFSKVDSLWGTHSGNQMCSTKTVTISFASSARQMYIPMWRGMMTGWNLRPKIAIKVANAEDNWSSLSLERGRIVKKVKWFQSWDVATKHPGHLAINDFSITYSKTSFIVLNSLCSPCHPQKFSDPNGKTNLRKTFWSCQ